MPFENNVSDPTFDAIQACVFWKNLDGYYLGCNQYFLDTFGLKSHDDFIGKQNQDLPWKNQAEDLEAIDKIVLEKGFYNGEVTLSISPSQEIIFHTKKSLFFDENQQAVGILTVSFDVTDRKKSELLVQKSLNDLLHAKNRAEASNKAKTEFLEHMRHDIRTPLTGIIGFAEIIKMEAGESLIREYADNLVASSLALLGLIDEMLESIGVGSGEIPKLKRKFDLRKTVQHVIDLHRSKAAEKNLKLNLNFDEQLPHFVIGDKIRVHRIILELIANALNFTDYGFVNLTATLAKKRNNLVIIKFIVEDSGIGMPKEMQQELYLQFKRMTPSYSGIYKGPGLGLTVIKQFIDELGGEIYVESKPYEGAKFTCILPMQESLLDDELGVDEEIDTQLERDYRATYGQLSNKIETFKDSKYYVLIVEDSLIAQKVAKTMLESFSCKVDVATTGKEALNLINKNSYDLIFMDIGLPDNDGYEIARRIRGNEFPKNTHAPIIALTAHAGEENKRRCLDVGMNAVLIKPLTGTSCTEIIENFISNSYGKVNKSTDYSGDLPPDEQKMFDLSDYPMFDIEEGIRVTGSKEMLVSMVTLMVHESFTVDFNKMQEAYQAKDWEAVQNLAHKIKGGAVYVGTSRIRMACQYLERYWKTGGRALLDPLYQQAINTLRLSLTEIKAWLAQNA
jgi:two-component system aerobic respiration control sensor histidine kinase ArcB